MPIVPVSPELSEIEIVKARAATTTKIKEDLQSYSRIDGKARHGSEYKKRGEYAWMILSSLGMLPTVEPKDEPKQLEAFQATFKDTSDAAEELRGERLMDLSNTYDDHPAISFLDTLQATSQKTTVIDTEIVMLRRSLLVLLDDADHKQLH